MENLRITFFFLITSFVLFSQDVNYVTGKLVDFNTQESIPYATIRFKEKAIGVITNLKGDFRIPKSYLNKKIVLSISSLGYESLEVKMSELAQNEINIITLKEEAISLNEAIVIAKDKKKLNAKRIVKKAIKAIPNNYSISPFTLTGYYRDYQLDEDMYVNLNEALLEVFDGGFNSKDFETIKVLLREYKSNDDFKIDSLSRQGYNYSTGQKTIKNAYIGGYGGNEFIILRAHDAIRNYKIGSYNFVDIMKLDFVGNHTFFLHNSISVNGEQLYVIHFRKSHKNFKAKGKLYISKKDFAIHNMEYSMYNINDKTKKQTGDFIKTKTSKEIDEQLIFKVITEYRRVDDKMYLNYISFQNNFELVLPPIFKVLDVVVNIKRKCIEIKFNDQPESLSAHLKDNYLVKYKNKALNLKSIDIDLKKNAVFLHPDLNEEELEKMIEYFLKVSGKKNELSQLLDVKVRDIYSNCGNLIHQRKRKNYYQHREFFVQQINGKGKLPLNEQFMDLNKPIYDNNINNVSENIDYWMNTPLLSNKN